jgi:hypothetical protein|tara:strand:- start:1870 stop:2178 length:309 start_codon:yes stop_codon:yes gene_type:complete
MTTGLMTGAVTTGVVGVASVLTPSAIVPAVVGGTTAAIVSATSVATGTGAGGSKVMNDCAPDNAWTALGVLLENGLLWIGLIALAFILIGWVVPSPTKLNRK